MSHLRRLKALVDKTEPLYVSEPLSWSRIGGFNSHDLLPLPYTEEALDIVCAKSRWRRTCSAAPCCSRTRPAILPSTAVTELVRGGKWRT